MGNPDTNEPPDGLRLDARDMNTKQKEFLLRAFRVQLHYTEAQVQLWARRRKPPSAL